MEVTICVKRRCGVGQAVGREVEAIEPRNPIIEKVDAFGFCGRQHLDCSNGLVVEVSPWSESMACPKGCYVNVGNTQGLFREGSMNSQA